MKYSHRWVSGVRQVGAKVLKPFEDVFHLDPSLAISFRTSSISACVGDSIILFPSVSKSLGNSNILLIFQVSKGMMTSSTFTLLLMELPFVKCPDNDWLDPLGIFAEVAPSQRVD